jgi:alkanesulfonate monooxygenase SsuD/methylene tetrahydromethanopterin reductase-like flavin-dependent oxidoreductase (luciferase family)
MALKIGFIPIEGGRYYREALEEVTRAEELGFDSVWMEEHHSVTNHYWPSPLTVLAGFATRTSRMTLGTDIVVAAFHHPVRLAEDVAMLDVMSGGRFVLGIAIGYKPDEFALYGVDLEKRGARFEEQLAIMQGLWTQERIEFKGMYYTLQGRLEPKPVQQRTRCGSGRGHHAATGGDPGRQLDPRPHRRSQASAGGPQAVPGAADAAGGWRRRVAADAGRDHRGVGQAGPGAGRGAHHGRLSAGVCRGLAASSSTPRLRTISTD